MAPKKTVSPSLVTQQKAPPADLVKKTISYLYLVSFCPPSQLAEFTPAITPLFQALLKTSGMDEQTFNIQVLPQACHHMVAYSMATRYPDEKSIVFLLKAAINATASPEALQNFQTTVAELSGLPGRAKMDNRLHRNKGCRLCNSACFYGYFSLVSDPKMNLLQNMLKEEAAKPAQECSPLVVLYTFAMLHLASLTGMRQVLIRPDALANLSFCLLLLSMAKSRLPLPEQQLRLIQAGNQEYIRRNQKV